MKERVIAVALLMFLIVSPVYSADEVVVYTSVDRMFSEPILNTFQERHGIKILPLYDVEASKTVGLVNRLIAEKRRPQADVFWNSEVIRTIQLVNKGVVEPYKSKYFDDYPAIFKDKNYYWTGFAGRARVLLYNTTLLEETQLPSSIMDFTKPEWKGRVTIAYPIFGTTAMHVAALYDIMGAGKTEAYLQGLVDNEILVVDGNSVTRDLVVRGRVPIGFTDTDDAQVAIDKGEPVRMIFPDSKGMGTLLIPNTVMLIKGSPNPENGKRLIDFLLSSQTELALSQGESAQIPLRKGSSPPGFKAMDVDYAKMSGHLESSAKFCQDLFVR